MNVFWPPIIGAALLGMIWLALWSDAQQAKWLVDHHCQKIGTTSGTYGYSFGQGGGSVYVPGKTGYRCDDGLEHWI